MKRTLLSIWETVEVILVAVLTVFLIRTFLVQPFVVSGDSMEPNFNDGNYLLIDEVTYHLRQPERGEVVVFRYPLNTELFFIKRVIGLPGEEISYDHGKIRVAKGDHSEIISEEYLPKGMTAVDFFSPITLGEGQYFVLGDNRTKSFDSRNWGSVPRENIVGIERLRIFPIAELHLFNTPAYGR